MAARIRTAISQRPVLAYFLLAFIYTWTGSLITYFASPAGGLKLPRLLYLPSAVVYYYGPALAAVTVCLVWQRKNSLRDLLNRYRIWRVGWGWYAFIFLYPLAMHFVVVGLDWLRGGPTPQFFASSFGSETIPTDNLLLTLLGLVLVQIFLRGFGEETGWRGFALPLMQKRSSAFAASLVLGLIWALWHFHPANFAIFNPFSTTGLFLIINIVGTTVIYTWVFNNTRGSLLIAALFHMTLNVSDWIIPIGLFNQADLTRNLIQAGVVWAFVAFLVLRFGVELGNQEAKQS